jgi:ATP-dependent DNA helicase RecG
MLTKNELKTMLKSAESYRLERTVSTTSTDKFCQAICAFSNDLPNGGMPGYLLLGVKDDGTLAGLKGTDELLQNIAALRSDGNILPLPLMSVEKFSFPAGDVLAVEVKPSMFPPVRYRGRVWVRIGPRKDIASEAEERVLVERRTAAITTFDTMPCTGMVADALDVDLFAAKYLKRAVSADTIRTDKRSALEQMAALRLFNPGSQCPTFAGLLLFGKNPKHTLHGAYVQYVRFGGRTNGSPILNELRFEENILTLVPRLDDFLDAAVIQRWPVPVSTLQEKMVYNYPRWAIRELMMNAIMHRDYQSNAPIRLYQYEDRIEIMNPGGLYGNARPENFPAVNDYRNPVIAEAMKVMDYVNMFSRGVGRVQEVLRENGNVAAVFDLGKITVFNVVVQANPEPAATGVVETLQTPIKTPMKTPMKILAILAAHPHLALPEVAVKIGKSPSAVHRACTKLIEQGLLKRVGPDKGGHWEVAVAAKKET